MTTFISAGWASYQRLTSSTDQDQGGVYFTLLTHGVCSVIGVNHNFAFPSGLAFRGFPPIRVFHSSSTVCFSISVFAIHLFLCSSSSAAQVFISLLIHSAAASAHSSTASIATR